MGSRSRRFRPGGVAAGGSGIRHHRHQFRLPREESAWPLSRRGFAFQVDTARKIVSRVRDAVPPQIPVTVKMRRGLDDTAESRDRFFSIFDGAFARGDRGDRAWPDGPAALHRPEPMAVLDHLMLMRAIGSFLAAAICSRHAACLEMMAHYRCRRSHGRARRDRQPLDFCSKPLAWPPGEPLPDPPSLFEQRDVIAEHYRLAEQIYGPEVCGRQTTSSASSI